MLKLFLTPTSIVFEEMDDALYNDLTVVHGLEFDVQEGEYKIEAEPKYLYKVLYKLSCNYDIEIN